MRNDLTASARRRRGDDRATILRLALDVMAEDVIGGLSLAAVARGLGVQPPALHKYFPSLTAIYDALFRRGQQEHCGRRSRSAELGPRRPARPDSGSSRVLRSPVPRSASTMANEPGVPYEDGVFTGMLPGMGELLVRVFPPG